MLRSVVGLLFLFTAVTEAGWAQMEIGLQTTAQRLNPDGEGSASLGGRASYDFRFMKMILAPESRHTPECGCGRSVRVVRQAGCSSSPGLRRDLRALPACRNCWRTFRHPADRLVSQPSNRGWCEHPILTPACCWDLSSCNNRSITRDRYTQHVTLRTCCPELTAFHPPAEC